MIVVIDSGVWISAMQFGGVPLRAVLKAIAEDRIAVCGQIEGEIERILTRRFGWESARVHEDLAFYWMKPWPFTPVPASA